MSTKDVYAALTSADETKATIEDREVRNGAIHLGSLSLTKIADGLVNPKLVLSWALGSLGAPSAFIGLLVPVREAGALLPQLGIAPRIAASRSRHIFWSLGSALQGFFALGIAASLFLFTGWVAGASVVACLAGLATARALCSVSYKDALALSIPKSRRGTITGLAGSVASAATLAFGALLAFNVLQPSPALIAGFIALAATFWLIAAAVFSRLRERKIEPENDAGEPLRQLAEPLLDDAQFRRFVVARALLTATALAPPFLLLVSAAGGAENLGNLGPFILASALAALLSSYIWGRFSDRSSRKTLLVAALLAAVVLAGAGIAGVLTGSLGGVAGTAATIFVAQLAYQGVRAGRSLHLTDMATDDQRARYTALSNTLIGIVLLVGGGLGAVSDLTGPAVVLLVLAGLCLAAVPVILGLEEVQEA